MATVIDPLSAVQNLAPLVVEHLEISERERRLPEPVVAALSEAVSFG